jgi:hypothetical protein
VTIIASWAMNHGIERSHEAGNLFRMWGDIADKISWF